MGSPDNEEGIERVRVTSPRLGTARRGPTRPVTTEIQEQTGLGEVYMAGLLRAQLRLSLTVLGGVAISLGALPLLFLLVPIAGELAVWRVPLPWLVLGVLIYPVIALAARYYVRQAEAIERDFADLVDRR
jgi:hypothetical protein